MLTSLISTGYSQTLPKLETNEAYIDEVRRGPNVQVNDPVAVLSFVLSSLPDRVNIYPTENYYYFRFVNGSVPYAGSLRLAPGDRDQGKVEFGYYKALSPWNDVMQGDVHAVLDASRGVKVEKVDKDGVRLIGSSELATLNTMSPCWVGTFTLLTT